MKIAKSNSVSFQIERDGIINNYYIVEDDYDFLTNNATDVTSFETLSIFASIGRFNYKLFRDSLIVNILPSFSGLSTTEKKNLILHRVYPSNYTDEDIISYIGVEGLKTINRTLSSPELIKREVDNINVKIDQLSGSSASKSFVTGYTQVHRYNTGGTSPTFEQGIKFFTAVVRTNASGVAIVQLTDNGLPDGGAIFSNIYNVQVTAQNNTTTLTDVPLASFRAINSLKTLSVNVVNSAAILLGGQGLEFAVAGITVHVLVIGT